jgi:photosystem II stability/assembly factor-like uncharacterized protein
MRLLSFVLLMPIFLFLQAQEIGEATLKGLQFRNVGPGVFSGRITDLAVQPDKPHIYYVATASGNAWKTVNAGVTWTPIFDDKASYSIGCMTIDPNNPHVIWLGTGENNSQRSVAYGDGVYKSPDGGKSWQHMGSSSQSILPKSLSTRAIRRRFGLLRRARYGVRVAIAAFIAVMMAVKPGRAPCRLARIPG